MDYNATEKIEQLGPAGQLVVTNSYTGAASGYFSSDKNLLKVNGVEASKIAGTITDTYKTRTVGLAGLGPVFIGDGLPGSVYELSYTCNDTSLIIRNVVGGEVIETYTFQRQKK